MTRSGDPFAASDPLGGGTHSGWQEPALAASGLIEGDRSYRIVREVGSGGMGTVYLAERADGQYRQTVAIKLVRGGRLDPVSLARFRAERQILASLDHPNVARLLDGGALADGAPFLVMEYVEGVPVDEYCREQALPLRARLELFLVLCDAVSAIHQRLIVHRDLKPGNILVTPNGVPKILDFGIAKLLAPAAEGWAVVETRQGMTIATLRYASPEQVQGLAVSTASDVFSLGVILFELLTGRSPYPAPLSALEMVRAICEEPPPVPSRAVTTGMSGGPVSGMKREEITRAPWTRRLPRDLDSIVLKAIRKDVAERYSSVEQLAGDLRAHLEGRPVSARRGERLYRANKFAIRHRWALLAASGIVALLIGWSATLRVELDRSRLERDRAQHVTRLLVELFGLADPSGGQGRPLSARELLDRVAARIGPELGGRPELRAELEEALGRVYLELGILEPAERLLRSAHAARMEGHGDPVGTLYHLAILARRRAEHADAAGLLDLALARAQAQPAQRDPGAIDLLREKGHIRYLQGDYEAAIADWRAALDLIDAQRPGDRLAKARLLGLLAISHQALGRFSEANPLLAEAEQSVQEGFADNPWRATAVMSEVAVAINQAGDHARAEALLRRALAEQRRLVPADHLDLATTLNNLGSAMLLLGDARGAVEALSESLEITRSNLGDDHGDLAISLANLGVAQKRLGDFAAAEATLRDASRRFRELEPDNLSSQAVDDGNLADVLLELGRLDEAEALYREALRKQLAAVGPEADAVGRVRLRLARVDLQRGRVGSALAESGTGLEILRRSLPADHPAIAGALLLRAELHLESQEPARALVDLDAAAAIHAVKLPATSWEHGQAQSLRGSAMCEAGRCAAGGVLLEAAVGHLTNALGENHPRTREARRRLAEHRGS